jgi:hypothetical protein
MEIKVILLRHEAKVLQGKPLVAPFFIYKNEEKKKKQKTRRKNPLPCRGSAFFSPKKTRRITL